MQLSLSIFLCNVADLQDYAANLVDVIGKIRYKFAAKCFLNTFPLFRFREIMRETTSRKLLHMRLCH